MPKQLSVVDLSTLLSKRRPVHIVDVRDAWERAIAKLPDQQHIPLGELPERLDELKPPPGSLLVLYCHEGVRSLAAAALLEDQGFMQVASLEGGIDAWSQVIDRAELPGRADVAALRLRTIATKDRPCADFPLRAGADYDPAVILELDYWTLIPR